MQRRYVTIWFRYIKTDWFTRRSANGSTLAGKPLVVYAKQQGRMVITAANQLAEQQGIYEGTVLADARAIVPTLQTIEDKPEQFEKIIAQFAEWFIRYAPIVAIDGCDGLIIDAIGCAHLWGGDEKYVQDISNRLKHLGYNIRIAMAGTIGAAWALAHYGNNQSIIKNGNEADAIINLPPQCLRINEEVSERLHKLGLNQVQQFITMPRSVLRRRFGADFIKRLNQALGYEEEFIQSVTITPPYQERLNCLEPIVTLTGIEIALRQLLNTICKRLQQEQKGIRKVKFICYRIDGKTQCIEIGTNRPTSDTKHLFKLFEIKLGTIEPALGIELFVMEATKVDEHISAQEKIWNTTGDLTDNNIALLLDRLANKIGEHKIHRYLPDEHYWPERSVKKALSLDEKPTTHWNNTKTRPLKILSPPEPITVTAPVPDYPPMLFRYKNKIHKIIRADGPERIEQEWWLQQGQHRDYYYVEDEEGHRYWLFRLGHYDAAKPVGWFLHGYCA
jgi:protein ImuB